MLATWLWTIWLLGTLSLGVLIVLVELTLTGLKKFSYVFFPPGQVLAAATSELAVDNLVERLVAGNPNLRVVT